jgi:hypothetical protein
MSFYPSAQTAQALRNNFLDDLSDSLLYLGDFCHTRQLAQTDRLETHARAIAQQRHCPPDTFGWYFELGSALLDDDTASAQQALTALLTTPLDDRGLEIAALGDPARSPRDAMFIRRLGDTCGFNFVPPSPLPDDAASRVATALDTIGRVAPDLEAEIRTLVRRIIFAAIDHPEYCFDGASPYQLWSAIFLNAQGLNDPFWLMEAMVHESAHVLLFAWSKDEPLVLNPGTERFDSPLRDDQRPMDGLYHAVFVLARLAWFMERVAQTSGVPESTQIRARSCGQVHAQRFMEGYRTVETRGQLTQTGRQLMQDAWSAIHQLYGDLAVPA